MNAPSGPWNSLVAPINSGNKSDQRRKIAERMDVISHAGREAAASTNGLSGAA